MKESVFKLFVWRENLGDWANHYLVAARDQNEAKKVLLEQKNKLIEQWDNPKEKERERKYWLKTLSTDWQEINVTINVDKPQVLKELS